ncbi:MAG: choice-of-anchor K domain-containing protein [Blastocatellia bacterium]
MPNFSILTMILLFAALTVGNPAPQTRGNGFVTGFFKNAEPPCATCNGLGTNTFSWGTPAPGSFQSSLTFLGAQFVNLPQGQQPFVAGKMLFRNGGSLTGGLPTYVTLVLQANSPDPAFNHNQEVLIHILNTPGNPFGIAANADWIWINEYPQYGKWGVAENGSTTVDVLGVIHSFEFAGWGKIDDPRVGFLAATVDPNDFTPVQPATTIAVMGNSVRHYWSSADSRQRYRGYQVIPQRV